MTLRKHQTEFEKAIQDKIAGAPFDTILVRATPGAGKSAIPIQATRIVRAGLADRICWVVPRDALRSQGEKNFLDPFFRKIFDHRHSIRATGNEQDPCRGTCGFVTTYQAIGVDSKGIAHSEFRRRRYILILDEFHHCELNGLWSERIQPLVDNAALVILMTGTLERGDGKPIAFLPYKEIQKEGYVEHQPDMSDPSLRYIEYTRKEALAEEAIIPMQFYLHDGSAQWEEKGRKINVPSIAQASPKHVNAALYTALRTDYARDLLGGAVAHWSKWRKKMKTAKLLVVCADYETAKEAVKQVKNLTSQVSEIATSHESTSAQRAIEKFKAGKVKVLVTIAMAYEGLDAPEVSHIACLSNIRSTPWIEQMIARAVRIDKAYQYRGQLAHIFAPDDPLMRKIVEKIENEQLSTIDNYGPGRMMEEEQLTLFSPELDDLAKKEPRVNPIGSQVTGKREWIYGNPSPAEGGSPAPQPTVTPREKEQALRKEIESHVRRYCETNRVKQQKVNSEIKGHFGKSRQQMTGAELGIVLGFVKRNFPTGYQVRGRRPPINQKAGAFHG